MADREKAINGLRHCVRSMNNTCPVDCPYHDECHVEDKINVFMPLLRDTLELLKEQKQALKREYMRGYDRAWDEIGR